MKWLRRLLGLCDHKWKIIETREVRKDGHRIVGTHRTLQCELCGNLKDNQTRPYLP